MNGVLILRQTEPQRLLRVVCEENIPIYISYLSAQKWRIARAKVTDVTEKSFRVVITPQRLARPASGEFQPGQTVGVSFKYGFESAASAFGGADKSAVGGARFVFGTTVATVGSTGSPQVEPAAGMGSVSLSMPDEIDVIQRRSFERVRPPEGENIEASIWSRNFLQGGRGAASAEVSQSWTGRLVDISAAGLAVAVSLSEGPAFEAGQFVSLKFTPFPNETPLAFNAYVKSVSQTADGSSVCLGLATVGLEASSEGRLVLQRLCNVVERYSQMNPESATQTADKSRIQNN